MDDTGETVTALRLPETAVEEKDGRIILTVDGEETDITDAMEQEGSYLWTREDEGAKVSVQVTLDEEGKPVAVTNVALPDGTGADAGMVMVTETGEED